MPSSHAHGACDAAAERRRQIEEERKFMQWLRNRCHIISLTDHEEWFTYEPGVGNKNVVVTGW